MWSVFTVKVSALLFFSYVFILLLISCSFFLLYFVIFLRVCDPFFAVVAGELNGMLFCFGVGRVNTSTPLHLFVWLHCGLLSSSCPLTGSGGWGLLPATYCDMLTKQAGTSRFRKICRKKEHAEGKKKKKKAFYSERQRPRLLSAALCCWRKASRFPPLYLMDGRPSLLQSSPASGVGLIARAGPTKPQLLHF